LSATVIASFTDNVADGGGAPAHLTNNAFFYVAIDLFSTNPSDLSVLFGSLASGAPATCGQVAGPFTSGTVYYMSGQYPQGGSLAIQTVHDVAGTSTLQGAGCALDNQNVFVGNNANIIIFSASDQYFN
jgi:hypothetical protein